MKEKVIFDLANPEPIQENIIMKIPQTIVNLKPRFAVSLPAGMSAKIFPNPQSENINEAVALFPPSSNTKSGIINKMIPSQIDISKVEGTGKDGRIIMGDLIDMMGINPKTSIS